MTCLANSGALSAPPTDDAFAAKAEMERIARTELWPGFAPTKTPLAFFDGHFTVLMEYPAGKAPTGFTAAEDYPGVWICEGRHAAVTANTSTMFDGVPAASLMLRDGWKESLTKFAGVGIHEAFHVFQKTHTPAWRQGNEATLFTYPMENVRNLSLRRQESEALRRALEASEAERLGWAARACAIRAERFELISEEAREYERGVEYGEGLAHYVEVKSTGESLAESLGPNEFGADRVRSRCYQSGAAIGLLLDQFSPDWKAKIEAGDRTALDELLASATRNAGNTGAALGAGAFLDELFVKEADARAEQEVKSLAEARVTRLQQFLHAPGWRLVIVMEGKNSLGLEGFDPLNVTKCNDTEILHSRYLKLGNKDIGSVEMLNGAALTEGRGFHPLFGGVQRVTLTALPDEPAIERKGDAITFETKSMRGQFKNATVRRDEPEKTVTILIRS